MEGKARKGQVLGGRYELAEPLGSGGFGRVWKATDRILHLEVAVKEVWLPQAASTEERSKRLARAVREARNAARLRDEPGIVTVHDVVIEDDMPWIVMQLVDGSSLAEHLRRNGPLSVDEAAKLAGSLLRSLGAAHAAGLVHRDVKPTNIMITQKGEALLTDFGIAVHQDDTELTATGVFIGALEFVAPERVKGQAATPASDLFSLGATLYQAVKGASPFHRDTPESTLAAVALGKPDPPKHAGRLTGLITRLMETEPGARPTVAEALALANPPQGPRERAWTQTRVLPPFRDTAPRQPRQPKRPKRPRRTPDWRRAGIIAIMLLIYLSGLFSVAGPNISLAWAPVAHDIRTGRAIEAAYGQGTSASGGAYAAAGFAIAYVCLPCLVAAGFGAALILRAVPRPVGGTLRFIAGLLGFGIAGGSGYLAVATGAAVSRAWLAPMGALWASMVALSVLLAIAVGWQVEIANRKKQIKPAVLVPGRSGP